MIKTLIFPLLQYSLLRLPSPLIQTPSPPFVTTTTAPRKPPPPRSVVLLHRCSNATPTIAFFHLLTEIVTLDIDRDETVVAVVKSSTQNGLADIILTLKETQIVGESHRSR
ncbi:uncharacterized protein LOC141596270 [Silene latifolia]|uniref:uncharacterized protein LOC141596270 n=1 Tax=Silene latifolia TaxID=37657 RepID=UPI003D7814FC